MVVNIVIVMIVTVVIILTCSEASDVVSRFKPGLGESKPREGPPISRSDACS